MWLLGLIADMVSYLLLVMVGVGIFIWGGGVECGERNYNSNPYNLCNS